VLDLGEVVGDVERMLQRLIGEEIHLTTRSEPGSGRAKVDRSQIEQVIMNLALNARDSMPRGGQVTIETSNAEVDASQAAQWGGGLSPGRYVRLSVSDKGEGMDPETLSHVFEPFFTTKEVGKGTGLGLSTVYGIVKQSGGYIWARSKLGEGTTFDLYLPRYEEGDSREREPATVAAKPPRGTGTVLLAEDDASVRKMIRHLLENCGYDVAEALNADEALHIGQHHEGPIDLLLTDVVMPAMSGPELAVQLTLLRPGMRVLYMSGYTDDEMVHHGAREEGVEFLQKPFSMETLARKARDVLETTPSLGEESSRRHRI
jgi:CheY-like chemotaxis protein